MAYKKLSTPIYPTPKSVQQTIPVYRISINGIFQTEPDPSGSRKTTTFDRCFRMTDVNYCDKNEAEQVLFLEDYCKCLNHMNTAFKIVCVNRNINPEDFRQEVLYEKKPGYEALAEEFNRVNSRRLENIRGIRREKYLVVTCQDVDFEGASQQFIDMEKDLAGYYQTLGCALTPLAAIDRLRLLYDFYNVGKETEFHLTEEDLRSPRDWKDDIICTYMKESKSMIEFEDHVAVTLFAAKYPYNTDDAFLHKLTAKPYNMTVTIDCEPVPNGATERMLLDGLSRIDNNIRRQQELRNRNQAYASEITYEVQRKRENIVADLDELHDNNARMFFAGYTVTVTAKNKQELDRAVNDIIHFTKDKNFHFKVYTGRQIQAMNTSLPIGYRGVKNMRSLFTQGVAAMTAFYVQELWDRSGIVYGTNQISKQLLIGNRKALYNGNGFIFGSPGYGKSMNAKQEICQVLIVTDDDVIIIDPANEYFDICRQWGGQVVNLSEKSIDYMNPLEIPDMNNLPNKTEFIAEKAQFMQAICARTMEPTPIGSTYRSVIDRCVRTIYEAIYNRKKKEQPTFVTFRDELLKQSEPEARELAAALEVFVDGSMSLFSHQSNVDIDNRLICYGINELGNAMRPLALLVMIENVANRIASNARVGKATWVYIDECHVILDDPQSCATFEKLWKEVRKKGGLMTGITQNLMDCLVNKQTRTIISNSEYISLLSQSEFEQDLFDDILNLSEAQLKRITKAPQGTGIMKFGDKVLAFDNTIPKESMLYQMFNTNLHEKKAWGEFESEVEENDDPAGGSEHSGQDIDGADQTVGKHDKNEPDRSGCNRK